MALTSFFGSEISDGTDPKSLRGQVFNSKLGRFASCLICWHPFLELKAQPLFCLNT
jgi:hypothetical protein